MIDDKLGDELDAITRPVPSRPELLRRRRSLAAS